MMKLFSKQVKFLKQKLPIYKCYDFLHKRVKKKKYKSIFYYKKP